jgi:hypothetical protein
VWLAEGKDTMVDFVAWHGETPPNHEFKTLKYLAEGYRFVSLSIYGDVNTKFA